MEDRLKRLIEAGKEPNRTKWALEWKKQGKKVIGVICPSLLEEVIYAAGMLPWHIKGVWRKTTPLATAYRPEYSCSFCTHALESLLAGDLDFLDGAVFVDRDQDLCRLWDVWVYLKKMPFVPIVHLPVQNSELAYQQLAKEIRRLAGLLEELGTINITDESLRHTIDVYNERRTLVAKIYELRKREVPPLSGAESLGITTAAGVMPADQFNQELRLLLPYLEERRTTISHVHPRLLLTSDMLDNPAYLGVVEDVGCLVAMDDLDTGARYFTGMVDTDLVDPAYALAKYYISNNGSPRVSYWDRQLQQMIEWYREYNIDGIVDLCQRGCFPRMWRRPFFERIMVESRIPYIIIDREYHLANVGQLQTRIQAFLEMITSKNWDTV